MFVMEQVGVKDVKNTEETDLVLALDCSAPRIQWHR